MLFSSTLSVDVLTKGTDNHMVLVSVANLCEGLSGVVAQRCLEECGIVVDFYRLPYDRRLASIGSGIRIGTPIVTRRGMGEKEMDDISAMMDKVIKGVNILSQTQYQIDEKLKNGVRRQVENLCSRFSVSKNSVCRQESLLDFVNSPVGKLDHQFKFNHRI